MNEWKNIHCMLYKADTPRLRSMMQNICFLISISAVTLKLMVKITSIFGSYRFLRIAWHDIFSLSDHFPASWNLYTVYSPFNILRSRRENAHLLVNPIPKLTIVLIWKTPPCLNFGKTSNGDVKKLRQRKLWVWAANNARFHKNLITPNFGERVLLRKR